MKKIAVIADDLTGAADAGVQFARKGLRTHVVFDWNDFPQQWDSMDAVVIDTDSRAIPGREAYQRVKVVAELLKKQGFTRIYKKLDSTLRGNIGQEISALIEVFGFKATFIAPAYPKNGRTTSNGIHYLNSTPINETEISRDPKTPVQYAQIATILASQSNRTSVSIGLSTLRKGKKASSEAVQSALEHHIEHLIFDVESDQDLELIADLADSFSNECLWAGSAGLADYMYRREKSDPISVVPRSLSAAPVIVVSGSISQTTQQQIQEVNKHPGITAIEVNTWELLDDRDREIARCQSTLHKVLMNGKDASLFVGSSPEQVSQTRELGKQLKLDHMEVSNRIAEALGQIVKQAVTPFPHAGLILTGGDTARCVCKHLGVHSFELINEVEPGMPIGRLLGAVKLTAITKAGAFGTQHSLINAIHYLKTKEH